MKLICSIISVLMFSGLFSQHNNELFNNGALVHVQVGAEVHVLGDVHMQGGTALLENNGLIKTHGNSYSDSLFQQTGTGTYRIENSTTNIGERQFISGSYAVRGGTSQIGVDDGSFYNLELANDQGIVYLVGAGNIADVRNSVNFFAGTVQNRIITEDVGINGVLTYPANGSNYSSVFGLMNTTSGITNLINNTVTANGNMSGFDVGYIQGKFRRAINPAGGIYNYVLGLEPAGAAAQRGMQYILLNMTANNYDVITGFFESASPNTSPIALECSGNTINYFGGVDHGEWIFDDITGTGVGTYGVQVWPQDHNILAAPIYLITKDNSFQGTPDDCGPTTVGLSRGGFSGFSGFSEFDVAAPLSALPIELLEINVQGIKDHIDITWNVASEINLSHYELERSEQGGAFTHIADVNNFGGQNTLQSYLYSDYDVRYFQDYYYRLKSVDYDGSFDYSPVVVGRISNDQIEFDENAVNLFPNPTIDDFVLSFFTREKLNISMTAYTSLGQIIMKQEFFVQKGNTVVNIDSKDWANGVYNVELIDTKSGQIVNKRIIKN